MFPFEIFAGYDLKDVSQSFSFQKDEHLDGIIADHQSFSIVLSGIVILFWENEDGNRTIIDFRSAGEILRPVIEITERVVGKIYALAYTSVEVMVLDRKFMCECALENDEIDSYFYANLTNDINSTFQQLKLLKVANLEKRYEIFLNKYQHIYNEISDEMIANYLGVHYTTLSRMKARFWNRKK